MEDIFSAGDIKSSERVNNNSVISKTNYIIYMMFHNQIFPVAQQNLQITAKNKYATRKYKRITYQLIPL
jgi:hypothetical protein